MIKDLVTIILLFALISGQLFRMQYAVNTTIPLLDNIIVLLVGVGLLKLRFKLQKPPLWFITALVFIVVASISLIFSPLKLSWYEYFVSFSYTLRLLSYLLFGWLVSLGVYKSLSIHKVLLASGLTFAIHGLSQFIFSPDSSYLIESGWDPHYFRAISSLFDPNFLGAFLVLTLIYLTQVKFLSRPKLQIILFIIIYLALATTFSRSSFIMFAVSFTALSILLKSKRFFLLTLFLIGGLVIAFISYQKFISEPRNIDRQQSAEYRIGSWKQGKILFENHPVLGVGFNSYRYALQQYHLASEGFTKSRGASGNDSSLLFIASTTGIIGLFSYGLFLLSLVYLAFRNYQNKNNWGLILLSAVPGLLVHSLFVNSLFYPWILIWIILVVSKANG